MTRSASGARILVDDQLADVWTWLSRGGALAAAAAVMGVSVESLDLALWRWRGARSRCDFYAGPCTARALALAEFKRGRDAVV